MDTIKKNPYGQSNFEKIRTENYAFVDKTRFIEMLENESTKYHFLIRPRKFGKSLFLSMLYHYYDFCSAAKFDALFGDLYIGKNPTPKRNSYFVVQFSFSGIDTTSVEGFESSFNAKIESCVKDFIDHYEDFIDADVCKNFRRQVIDERGKIGVQAFENLVFNTANRNQRELFVMIDEYDHFVEDLITKCMNDEREHILRSVSAVVRCFYEILKEGTSDVVDRFFITGCSPMVVDDFTGSFNIADNLTLKKRYNNMMGFTTQEVEQLIDETEIKRHLIDVKMESYYGGYLFSHNATDHIYNPSMIFNYLDQLINYKSFHQNVFDNTLPTDYVDLQRFTQNEANIKRILQILKDGGTVSRIHDIYYNDVLRNPRYFASRLFYMGLLTIEKSDFGDQLRIPNYSIKSVFRKYDISLRKNTHFSKAIFLDIDGVIQPLGSRKRFEHIKEFDTLSEELSQKFGVDYCRHHPYDVGAVYFDWDKTALNELQRILDITGAKIVISSDWRYTIYIGVNMEKMIDFFKIYGMDEYLVDATSINIGDNYSQLIKENPEYEDIPMRSIEILEYLKAHPFIQKYVAIDDMPLDRGLGKFAVVTKNVMTGKDADRCIAILNS